MIFLDIYVGLLIVTLISFITLLLYLNKSSNKLTKAFSLLSLFIIIYLISTIGMMLATNDNAALFFHSLKYFGAPFIAPAFVMFLWRYYDQSKITTLRAITLFTPAFFIMVAGLTNGYHYLYSSQIEVLNFGHYRIALPADYGIFHITGSILTSFVYAYAIYIPLKDRLVFKNKLNLFSILLITNTVLVLLFFGVKKLLPIPLDTYPLNIIFQLVIFVLAIFYFKLFEVSTAESSVFTHFKEGVIIIDKDFRLLRYNYGAMNLFDWLSKDKLHKSIEDTDIGAKIAKGDHDFIYQDNRGDKTRYFQFKVNDIPNHGFQRGPLYVVIFNDISKQIELQNHLESLSKYDGLTSLYNQYTLLSELERTFTATKRQKGNFILTIIDLHNFKSFNDKYGHLVGNEVLKFLATSINDLFPDTLRGRFGGDEFIVATNSLNDKEFSKRIYELVESLNNFDKKLIGDSEVKISIGMATANFKTFSGTIDFEKMLEVADKAMYRSKSNGSNVIELVKLQ